MRGWLAVPLMNRNGHNLGLIRLSDKYEGDFTAEDEQILLQFARIASVAIENVRLYRQVQGELAERKRIEEAHKIYRLMFEFSNDGIAVIDPDGYYLEQNEAHARLIGYSDEELRRKTPAIHLGEDVFASVAQELKRTGKFRGKVVARTKYGTNIDIDLSAFAVLDEAGVVVRYVGIKRDITDRKRAEKERERLLRQLQAERTRLERSQAELHEKILDLEKFEEVVVGRELKMISLEKEVERLKREIEQLQSKGDG